jgi:hypothetical protein
MSARCEPPIAPDYLDALVAEVETLRAEVGRLKEALIPLVAVIPDICDALDVDPDETSIRVRVDDGARDGEVLAERSINDMLTAARAALAAVIPAIQNTALERAAAWHDEQADGEDALAKAALGLDDNDYRLRRHLSREHIWSAAAIRALKEGT